MDKPILEQQGTYKGYKWCVLFQPLGHRTAYVLVPDWHKVYGIDYNKIKIKCHGGLTFSSHKLLDTEFFGWWIGFDCAHSDDKIDTETQRKYFGEYKRDSYWDMLQFITGNINDDFATVKNLDFCVAECKNIIDQLIEME